MFVCFWLRFWVFIIILYFTLKVCLVNISEMVLCTKESYLGSVVTAGLWNMTNCDCNFQYSRRSVARHYTSSLGNILMAKVEITAPHVFPPGIYRAVYVSASDRSTFERCLRLSASSLTETFHATTHSCIIIFCITHKPGWLVLQIAHQSAILDFDLPVIDNRLPSQFPL